MKIHFSFTSRVRHRDSSRLVFFSAPSEAPCTKHKVSAHSPFKAPLDIITRIRPRPTVMYFHKRATFLVLQLEIVMQINQKIRLRTRRANNTFFGSCLISREVDDA